MAGAADAPPLVIALDTLDGFDHGRFDQGPVVAIEPLYGCVAVAAALDAGWASVQLDDEAGEPPIPLVSFEQSPPVGQRSDGRCRVRSRDLFRLADVVLAAGAGASRSLVLASPANLRPAAASVATLVGGAERITLLVAPASDELLTLDATWAAGAFARVLLEELDDRATRMADSAGIAVTLAQGAEAASVQLSAGARWSEHLERGGHPDDLRVAAAVDTVPVVPLLRRDGGALVARALVPEPISSATDA